MTLDQIWKELRGRLTKVNEVQTWTAADGYLGDRFIIVGVKDAEIQVAEAGAQRALKIPDADFVAVLGIWDAYAEGKTKPGAIEKLTKFPKYVTSILRALEAPPPRR